MSDKSEKKGGSDAKPDRTTATRIQTAVRDSLDQTVDEYMPSVVEAIRGFVKKSGRMVDAEAAFTKFMPYISVALGQFIPEGRTWTHIADNIRSRFFAEYRKQVKEEQEGKTPIDETSKAKGTVSEQREKAFTDGFITFLMLVPPDQSANFLKAIDSLSPTARREVRRSLGAIHHRQLQDVIKRMSTGPTAVKFDENYWRDIMVIISKFASEDPTATAGKSRSLAEAYGEVQMLILELPEEKRGNILALLKTQVKPDEYSRLMLMLSKLGADGLVKLAELGLEDQKMILGLVKSEATEPDKNWFYAQLERLKKWRSETHERDRKAGKTLADMAVDVVRGDSRLSGIVPLFEGFANMLNPKSE